MNNLSNSKIGTQKSSVAGSWFRAARPPFHTVGIFPFVLGSVLSFKLFGVFNWPVFIWGLVAVILIMLTTYLNGEFYDAKEDEVSKNIGKSNFAGGSQVMFEGILKPKNIKSISTIIAIVVMLIGILIQFYYKTGDLTIPLGALGIIAGFFYSKPPFRWVSTGFGEIMIGFCYGWLPVAVAFYIQSGSINDLAHWISIPIACTIFNVILINEFPDYPADSSTNKTNLTVRLGREKAAIVYVVVTILAWIFLAISVMMGVPENALFYYIPVLLVSIFLIILVLQKKYLDRNKLEMICGLTIVTNLGTSLIYIISILTGALLL